MLKKGNTEFNQFISSEEDLIINEPTVVWIPRPITHTDIKNHVIPVANKLAEKEFIKFLLNNYKELDNYNENNKNLHKEYDFNLKLMAEQIETWLFKVDDVGFYTVLYFWMGTAGDHNRRAYRHLSSFRSFLIEDGGEQTEAEFITQMHQAVNTIYLKHIKDEETS